MNNNQNQNQNQNQNEIEMKNLQKKVTKNLIKDYSNLLNGNSFHDFSIFVENESNPFEFKVHKSILFSRSPFFNKFLKEQNDIDKIFLNQFNKKEMESILKYIYYGNISFENQENLFELLEISIYFKLNLLKEFIQKKISNSVNYSNFFQFFFQNRDLKSNEIEIKCFELINQNFSQIQNNENLFNLTEKEIIKFIQFKQEKKEIFQFDFFQFLNNWIKKRNEKLKLRGKKEIEIEIEKKRLFHSFFSLFDKDSIPKQDFDKLKEFDFLPKSFLINLERNIFEIQAKEKETKIKEKEKKIQRRDKRIKSFEIENQKKVKESEDLKSQNQKKDQKIHSKSKEIINLKSENEKKEKEIIKLKSENKKKDKILKKKDEEIQNLRSSFQKEIEKEKQKQKDNALLNFFSVSEIVKDIEYVLKLQEWINDNEFFSKMKKGYSAKIDGFSAQNWHSAVDNKGKTLVIIKTKDNFIFGGFTQIGWTMDQSKWSYKLQNPDRGWIIDPNAFIFSLRNDKGNRKPEKFPIKQGEEHHAFWYNYNEGPDFGNGADIELNSYLQPGRSNFGYSYHLPNGIKYETKKSKSYLAGSYNEWIVDELETYFI
ncbi:pep-cterm sorting domain-containing protein [Anaeramoeba ignava]|uniref:Pep-cterm sorting domain-containing protein n=1 Tax=Anaeramoeba ignava TaxID=1746090 RepID=A0A9Q0LD09_ANAIG|nr:pep-cterm sorting domain-containing protein [Anaeramoeba ignava]